MFFNLEDYELKIIPSEDGRGFIATLIEIPTLSGFGDTIEDAINELKIAFGLAREVYEEDKEKMPEPYSRKKYSGQFRIRIPKDLHYQLSEAAGLQQVSLNQLVVYLLSRSVGALRHE